MSEYLARCKKALALYRAGVPTALIAERFGMKRPSINRMISDANALEKETGDETETIGHDR